jgi:hypothetical protein
MSVPTVFEAGALFRQMLDHRARAQQQGLHWAVVGMGELLSRWLDAAGGLLGEW